MSAALFALPLPPLRLLAEVPPPPPQTVFALFELLKLVGLVIALGLANAWQGSFGALFAWLGDKLNFEVAHVRPLGFMAHGLRAAASRVQHFFGHLALAREGGFVTFITWTSRTQPAPAHELAALSADTYAGQQRQQKVFLPWFVSVKLHPLRHSVGQATSTATQAARTAGHAASTATAAKAATTHTKAIAHTQAIAVTRPWFGRLEHDLAKQKARLAQIAALVTLAGFTGFMWRWLGRYGLRWLRCPALARAGSRIGCGGFSLLEDLLALTFVPFVLTDACRIVGLVEQAAIKAEPFIRELVLGIEGFVCGGVKSLPSGVTKGDLTRVTALPTGL